MLTIGAGNIGYLTSYQAMQAGASVKAIIEAMPKEGGFPVQANRIRRLGVPIMLSHILLKAIPNKDYTGITGAVIAQCENFTPIQGTEKIITDIDIINICTGLIPDDQLLIKGNEVFGRNCFGAGDAIRIGEGTSAVLRGKQCAFEIMQSMKFKFNQDEYLATAKEYIDSQQHPIKIADQAAIPTKERRESGNFVQIDCLYGFACNPCSFACKYGAITKTSTSITPQIDYNKCIGCMDCVYQCPGLAIFGYNLPKKQLFLPFEYDTAENTAVFLVDNEGKQIGEGIIEKILLKPNKTNIARIAASKIQDDDLLKVRGFIPIENYPAPLILMPFENNDDNTRTFVCHCDDIELTEILKAIGDRPYISVDEIKHLTRIGMGPCRGKRCIPRLRQLLAQYNISMTGDSTPRGPMSNQLLMGELNIKEAIDINILKAKPKEEKVGSFIAGGGIAGSALFRYMSEAGMQPVMVNCERGSSWRNIAGGRPAFSIPEISDIAMHNRSIFENLNREHHIDFYPTRYVGFAHDDASYKALEASKAWSDAFMVDAKNFTKEISPYLNPAQNTYHAALITNNCWQANPGKTIDAIRQIGCAKGGRIIEDCKIVDIEKTGNIYNILVKDRYDKYTLFHADYFVNALGSNAGEFAKKLGIAIDLFPVKHQAFITRRMPFIGKNGEALDMLIDRRKYKGLSAVYGQQLRETGQIIACASPLLENIETDKNLKINSREFLETVAEVFINWIPQLGNIGFQAVWSGYYVEPRYIVDPEKGLMVGLRGHGFMLGQYLAKLYVDKLQGKEIPNYFNRMQLNGDGLSESAFK